MLSISPELATELAVRLVPHLTPVESGCILSSSGVNPVTGYSTINTQCDGRQVRYYAHRIMYTHMVGPIPEGLTLDHLCKVHNCVNPKHLEAVTQGENVRRSDNPCAINARKILCKRGHEFTFLPSGRRMCRVCQVEMRTLRGKNSFVPMKADDQRHGTPNGYTNRRCRCVECKAAQHRLYVSRRDAVAA